jgi:predicted aspartyl protease
MRELADKVIDTMKATPFVLALLIINIAVLGGFAFTLHEVGNAIERRDGILEKCIR